MDLIMDKPERVQVLVVEDNEDHALLAVEMLDFPSSVDFQVSVVGGLTAAREHLFNSTPDCVLLDLTLPDARRLEGLRQLETIAPEVAIVILSGLEDELLAVRAVQEGAQDYLIKGRADAELLRRSIRYATQRKRAELDFTRNAMRDSLTGLPNRALFVDRLTHALTRARRRGSPLSVLFLDLDGFKLINDSLGHAVGDELLVAVAERLREVLRESDTAARYGSDEFILLCEHAASERDAIVSAERVLAAVNSPFMLETQEVQVSASIGIAIGGIGFDDPPEALIRDADVAMYRARTCESPYVLFDSTMRFGAAEAEASPPKST